MTDVFLGQRSQMATGNMQGGGATGTCRLAQIRGAIFRAALQMASAYRISGH